MLYNIVYILCCVFVLFSHDLAWKDYDVYKKIYKNSIEYFDDFFEFHHKLLMQDSCNNACYYCVDRHAAKNPDKQAIIWHGDEYCERKVVTYKGLQSMVCTIASMLLQHGITKGDIVTIYCSTCPKSIASMLACTRIGAIHSVVFGGFSAQALYQRILQSKSKIIITQKQYYRGGKKIDLLEIAKQIPGVKILLLEDIEENCDFINLAQISKDDTLFELYTSGTTSAPKPITHKVEHYLLYVAMTFKYIFDVKPRDVMFCTSDIGWITGHSYIVYAPLFFGITTVIFSGSPTYPNADRYWTIIENEQATIFYTAPTALRSLSVFSTNLPKSCNLSSLRILGSVGEPLDDATKKWYSQNIGNEKLPILDTWWQTEIGGVAIAPLLNDMAYNVPFFGIQPIINDTQLFINGRPTGDRAKICDNSIKILGRLDDVLNISGHRLSATEIEHAILSIDEITECCVIGVPHEIKGESAYAFIVTEEQNYDDLIEKILQTVRKNIGSLATPDDIVFTNVLPKNRSGKYIKNILKKLSQHEKCEQKEYASLADHNVIDILMFNIEKHHIKCPQVCKIDKQ